MRTVTRILKFAFLFLINDRIQTQYTIASPSKRTFVLTNQTPFVDDIANTVPSLENRNPVTVHDSLWSTFDSAMNLS